MTLYWLLLGILGAWRLTHLFHAEDGPWDLMVKLRRMAGNGSRGRLLDCFYCLSLWIAAPFGFFLGASWGERLLLWLASSAGAIFIHEFVTVRQVRPAVYVEEKEIHHAVLRPETPSLATEAPEPRGAADGC